MTWAKVGVKCVCVDANPYGGSWKGIAPVEGQVYVFVAHRGASMVPNGSFETLSGQLIHNGGRVWIDRFRALITQADDIALIKSLLLPVAQELVRERELATIPSGLTRGG